MNTHRNARLTFVRRLEMVQDITKRGLSASQAAAVQGVTAVTARKWLGRYLADGVEGLADKSSRPSRSPRAINPNVALAIIELRRKLFTQSRIATYLGVSKATVSRVLRQAGLSRFCDLAAVDIVQRYEREAPGDLLHIDIKKLGKFSDIGHRITGDCSRRTRGLGPLATPATIWASGTNSPGPIGRRPTARPSASSSRRCASGPMAVRTSHLTLAVQHCRSGITSTTGTARITASAACLPCLESRLHERTS